MRSITILFLLSQIILCRSTPMLEVVGLPNDISHRISEHIDSVQDLAAFSQAMNITADKHGRMYKASQINKECGHSTSAVLFRHSSYIRISPLERLKWNASCINSIYQYATTNEIDSLMDSIEIVLIESKIVLSNLKQLMQLEPFKNISIVLENSHSSSLSLLQESTNLSIPISKFIDKNSVTLNNLTQHPNIRSYVSNNCSLDDGYIFPDFLKSVVCDGIMQRRAHYPRRFTINLFTIQERVWESDFFAILFKSVDMVVDFGMLLRIPTENDMENLNSICLTHKSMTLHVKNLVGEFLVFFFSLIFYLIE